MKSVLGTVVSSKPVSLSKAARILSKFASSDNGASPAFSAYLKRASVAFDELVPLHKELRGAGFELIANKRGSSRSANEQTIDSVGKPSEDGLITEEKQGDSERERCDVLGGESEGGGAAIEVEGKKSRDEGEGSCRMRMEVETSEGIVNGNAAPVGGDARKLKKKKKKKKKRESDEVVAIVDKNQTDGEFDAMDADEVKNDGERQNWGTEMNKKKKKKKRDKDEWEKLDGALKIEKEEGFPPGQNYGTGEASEIVENDGSEQKKQKKKKTKGKEDRSDGNADKAKSVDNRVEIEEKKRSHDVEERASGGKVELVEAGKKHKKKRGHDREESVNGVKFEIDEAGEKESRKRKHKGDAHGGLDDSEGQHKSKKKKKKVHD